MNSMDQLERLLYATAQSKTKELPLGALRNAILEQSKSEPQQKQPLVRPMGEGQKEGGITMKRAVTLLIAAVLALTLFAMPALAQTVVVDGKTYVAFNGKVSIDGVIHDLNAPAQQATLTQKPQSNEYMLLEEETPAPTPKATDKPVPPPMPTPSGEQLGNVVSAVTPVDVYVTSQVTLYEGPGEGYGIVGVMNNGEQAVKTGVSNGGWARILWMGKTAYAPDAEFTHVPQQGGARYPEVPQFATEEVNVRAAPRSTEDSQILGKLQQGDRVVAIGSLGDWTAIQWEDGMAYVYSKYLENSMEGEEREQDGCFVIDGVSYDLGYPEAGTRWSAVQTEPMDLYATADVTLHCGPGEGYGEDGSLFPGQRVKKVGFCGEWMILLYEGNLRYAHKDRLKIAPTTSVSYEGKDKIVIAQTGVWALPRTDGEAELLEIYPVGKKVVATGSIGEWAQIKYQGGKAYVLQETLANPWEVTYGESETTELEE